MVYGAKKWDNPDTYYSQENNPTEAFLKATVEERAGWLESCGPTAAVNCLAAMGVHLDIVCPGDYRPQPEEVLMDFFNDPRNRDELEEIRNLDITIPENRVPQFYPYAVMQVFGVSARFEWGVSWGELVSYLKSGHSVQVCLKSPGHYIAVVAYDSDEDVMLYNDPWGSRFADGKGGWHRRLFKQAVAGNLQEYLIVYGQ